MVLKSYIQSIVLQGNGCGVTELQSIVLQSTGRGVTELQFIVLQSNGCGLTPGARSASSHRDSSARILGPAAAPVNYSVRE
jgi:hypothetical protein